MKRAVETKIKSTKYVGQTGELFHFARGGMPEKPEVNKNDYINQKRGNRTCSSAGASKASCLAAVYRVLGAKNQSPHI
jgi:hypothetical protein